MSPSRTAVAPAATRASSSSGAIPPSGPTTTRTSPLRRRGRREPAGRGVLVEDEGGRGRPGTRRTRSAVCARRAEERAAGAAGLLGRGEEDGVPLAARPSRRAPPATGRRCARPATAAPRRRRARWRPRPPGRRGRSSPAPGRGRGAGWARGRCAAEHDRTSSVPAPTATTSPSTRSPAPSVSTRCSPTRVRRTVAACRPSGPSRDDRLPRAAAVEGLGGQEVERQRHRGPAVAVSGP